MEVPDWNQVFRDATWPTHGGYWKCVIWKAKLPPKLVKRADVWIKKLGLSNVYFMYANGTTSLDQPVSSYPGPWMLVSILCSDPYLKRKHHKRRIVQKPLVDSTVNN